MDEPKRLVALIVDDNDLNRKLARDVLQADGIETLESASAATGLELAREHLPDVVLMDLRLPDRDGADTARDLRSDPRTSAIPIVALSAMRLEDADAWIRQAGFVGHLTKPIDADTFPQIVRGFCCKRTD